MIELHLITLLTAAALQAQTTYHETVLHSFAQILAPYGARSIAPLVRDRAGNLYGTTYAGGTWAQGTVFKIDPSGYQAVLHSFTGGPDGGLPYAGLVIDEAGNLFGTAAAGGKICSSNTDGCGVVFQIDPAGHETVLYSFSGPDGETPFGGVARDAAGNLYGTTGFGGKNGVGVVFRLDPAGQETVLHNFSNGADGGLPNSGVILDSGDLYGTTNCGGTGTGCSGGGGAGVVYRIDNAGHLTVLYNFSGGADGSQPYAGVIRDADGNLYGTTEFGGSAGKGVVYQLDPAGHQTVLHSFTGGTDGSDPIGSLLRDPSGNLYGTSAMGGTSCACGVVFKLDPSRLFTVLHRFTGSDGALPEAGLVADPAGNLYGTAAQGGFGEGVVFKIDAAGSESALFAFPARIDGMNPLAALVRDSAGNLYGTASAISVLNTGSVFKLDPLGRETILHIFTTGDGAEPASRVTLDGSGHLFGTTYYGGANGKGIVYRLDRSGSETVLHTFTGGADGANPTAGVILDADGNLYGTATYGGSANQGVLYKIDPSGTLTMLHTFFGMEDGSYPEGDLTIDAAGNLYGTASSGVVFRLDQGGEFSVRYTFAGGAGGSDLESGVILDTAGNLYGTAYQGGIGDCFPRNGCGLVYRIEASGHETVLHSFTGGPDGGSPVAGLVFDSAGNLYGTTEVGGASGRGVVFMLDAAGHETVLHDFAGPPDGSAPRAGVTLDPDSNIFGTTYQGGKQASGVVFRLSPAAASRK